MRDRDGIELVWIPEEECVATIVGPMGAYYTTVRYVKSGIEFEVLLENNEFTEDWDEGFIEYDCD